MLVYKIREDEVEILVSNKRPNNSSFNPIQDKDDNWIISEQEIEDARLLTPEIGTAILWQPKD